MVYKVYYASPLGQITLAAEDDALIGLWFEGQKHFGSTLPKETQPGMLPVLLAAQQWLDDYFQGRQPGTFAGIRLKGTPFQQKVWAALQTIPNGQRVTYGWVAEKIGQPGAAQAVGGAVGRNPISIIVPCHRVLGRDGSLTGYAGGEERKKWLLEWENYGDR